MAQDLAGVEIAERTGYTVVQISRLRRRFAEEGVPGCGPAALGPAADDHGPEAGADCGVDPEAARRGPDPLDDPGSGPEGRGVPQHRASDLARPRPAAASGVDVQVHDRPRRGGQDLDDVVGLYLNPPTNAVVLSLDEKTQIQALSRTQPLLPVAARAAGPADPRLSPQRLDQPVRRPRDRQRAGHRASAPPRHTGADFLRFLRRVARRYRGRELHVILDNSSTHSTPAVQAWLAQHPNVHFHFTPKGASWLNMVEAWFGILTRKSVRRGSFDTVRALIRHIEAYIADWNSHPTPVRLDQRPAAIIKKALRAVVNMTSKTGH